MFTQTAFLALVAGASAHIIMQSPVPFAWEDAGTKQFPLEVSQFPCKQPSGAYKVTEMNQWNAGETKGVKLIGGATHGGGSCQFSITTDTKPTKDSQWKVIHSVIGGCPGGSPENQNTSDNPEDPNIPEIDVKMPDDLPSGQYTFAWSWLNKVGNREFYMNCAPIQVGSASEASTASADVSSVLGSLPDMFTINLPATECANTIYQDFEYPNPGQSVVRSPTAQTGSDTVGSGCAAMEKLGAGKGSLGSPSQGTPSTPSEAPASSAVPSAPASSAKPIPTAGPDNGVTGPGASSAPAAQPSAQPTTAPSTTPSEGSADCTPCTNDGAVVCIGTNQYGLCNRGCAVAQPLAAGMACVDGALAAAVKPRHIHFPRAHLRRLAH
ncbi:lytic polysaccharide monooxygenase [Lentithecium fluviatile CBS 122367]|uniref:Lytic polysaccharide monooxygenase n=1 Tax=Lentithecium fluviatile CBS 122367 TaxID=1168545 RepID=A0A6G1J4Y3_9PLEO|nr:lytic polysaccharide monooxygenase [Lentithecium fluviatile CBS 122367]